MLKKIHAAGTWWFNPIAQTLPFFLVCYIFAAIILCLAFHWWFVWWIALWFFVGYPAGFHLLGLLDG